MKRTLRFTFFTLLFVSLFTIFSYGQETTGGLQGTVKDTNGAVITGATVTASNSARTFTETTNDSGEYTFSSLPPGVYAIDVKAGNFGPLRREAVTVELGKTIQANFEMKAGVSTTTVTIVADDEPLVDTSSSKTSTNITEKKIDMLPKGLRFSSVIEIAPGTRNEPKGNGFQIDGATGSENVWVVDGLEVTRTFGGSLGSTKNVPLDFVKEVQVKSAGYEAEFGGALGGVINVTSRPGGNTVHGAVSSEWESSDWRSHDRFSRRYDRANLAAGRRIPDYYINPKGKDDFTTVAPRINLNGPILKNKTWFSIGWAPDYTWTKRTIYNISPITATTTAVNVLGSRDLEIRNINDYMFGRIDASPIKKLSAYVSYFNSPSKTNGAFPAGTVGQGNFEWPQTAPVPPTVPSGYFDPRLNLKGGFVPANAFSSQATYNVLSNMIVSFRFGRNYLNDKGGNYDINTSSPTWAIVTPCNPAQIPGCPTNTQSAASFGVANSATSYDVTTRRYMALDSTWIARLGGQQHTIKGGFQRTDIANNVLNSSGGSVALFFGQNNPVTNQQGPYGYYTISQTGVIGKASSRNDALFIQDGWQIHRRITLNLGLRSEHETVPSWGFGGTALPAAIDFSWKDKLAPRLGGAWDVNGDGRLKIYGSYSVFFDTMKYDLPRGSFGGETQTVTYRGLDTFNFMSINLANQPGTLFAFQDQRTVSTNDYLVGNRRLHGIDPNLMPTREHEMTVGADYAWKSDLGFSARFTRKVLDRTIDDTGIPSENFENYCICNPGFGASVADLQQFGYPATPKAVRNYTGFEFRVDKRFSHNWYVNATYLRSRLFGNYSGLASSDESGRGNPNVNRFYDVPWINYTSSGALNNGLLATDRPNTMKVFAGRQFNYHFFGKKMETYFGGSQYIYQGTPLSSTVQIQLNGHLEEPILQGNPPVLSNDCSAGGCNHGVSILINGRGDLGRTNVYTQTDGTMTHRIYLSERAVLRIGANVFNLLNQGIEVDRSTALIRANTPSLTNEYNAPAATLQFGTLAGNTLSQAFNLMLAGLPNYKTTFATTLTNNVNPFYNKPVTFQGPRQFRFNVGLQF